MGLFGSKPEDKQVPLYEIDDYTPEVATQKKYKLQQKYNIQQNLSPTSSYNFSSAQKSLDGGTINSLISEFQLRKIGKYQNNSYTLRNLYNFLDRLPNYTSQAGGKNTQMKLTNLYNFLDNINNDAELFSLSSAKQNIRKNNMKGGKTI